MKMTLIQAVTSEAALLDSSSVIQQVFWVLKKTLQASIQEAHVETGNTSSLFLPRKQEQGSRFSHSATQPMTKHYAPNPSSSP